MKAWEYLQSKEYQEKTIDWMVSQTHPEGPPPWLDDDYEADPFNAEKLQETLDSEMEVRGKHAGDEDTVEDVDGKHKA